MGTLYTEIAGPTYSSSPILVAMPAPTNIAPVAVSNDTMGANIIDFLRSGPNVQTTIDQQQADYWNQQRQRYDYAMSKSKDQLAAEGIVVTTDNGSLFKDNYAWLPIQDIQFIENERGTAGALLMHLQEVSLATDTAGYQGAGTASGGSTQVTQPIPEVPQPPATTNEPAMVPPSPGTVSELPPPIATAQQGLNNAPVAGGKYWWVWYLLAAVIIILYLKYGRK